VAEHLQGTGPAPLHFSDKPTYTSIEPDK